MDKWIKAGVIGTLISAFCTGLGLFLGRGVSMNLSAALFFVASALLLTSAWLAFVRKPKPISKSGDQLRSLAFRLLKEEAEVLLKAYRRLGFDDPQNTKTPLNPASWPNFTPPTQWTYTQVQICSLKGRLDWLIMASDVAFREARWSDHVEVFQAGPSTVMALERFQSLLQSKIDALER
jgi:hypothetical protein